MKTNNMRLLEYLLISDIKSGKTPDKKILKRVNGPHNIGHVDSDSVSNMELKIDNWEYPRCLHVFENNTEYATIEIPMSNPNNISIISGNLSESQKRKVLTILKEVSFGLAGWELAWFFLNTIAPQMDVE